MSTDEMEKYKAKDREEEAGSCEPVETSVLIDNYEKEIWKLKELLSRALQDTNTLEGTKRIVIELSKEKIVLKKRAQEAEGELSILRGIETNRVKEAQARCNYLQDELDRTKKDNNDLYNRVAELIEISESHQKLNGKLRERLTELEEENKKMHAKLDERMDSMRKSGM
jgi:DNA repair exonuclease SbcCD ATPase subunit